MGPRTHDGHALTGQHADLVLDTQRVGAAAYKRKLNGGSEVITAAIYYTGGGKYGFADDTDNYLEVAQQDAAGWWSAYSSAHHIYVTPCVPLNGETGVYPRVALEWRCQKGDYRYTLWMSPVVKPLWKSFVTERPVV